MRVVFFSISEHADVLLTIHRFYEAVINPSQSFLCNKGHRKQ